MQAGDPLPRAIDAGRGADLVFVANDDVRARQCGTDRAPVFFRSPPKRGTVVEVEDRRVPVSLQRRHVRGTALVASQAGARSEQDRCLGNRPKVEVVGGQFPVRAGRLAVEEQREAVRRPDLAEDDGGVEGVIDPEPARVHTLAGEKVADEFAVPIVADLADDGGAHLQSSQARGDVAGEAAHVSDVVPLLAQWRPDLCRVDVRAEPTHHDDLGATAHVFFQSISHSWSGSVLKSHSRTAPAIAFK